MKQIFSVFLVFLTVFALSSCGAQSAGTDDTVDVVIPASFITDENKALTPEQKKQGIQKAVVHEDGSVTFTFSRSAYEDYIKELKKTTEEGLNQIINGEQATSIKQVTYNDDFSELTFTVDRAAFEGSLDGLTCYGAYLAVSIYKAYAQKDDRCTIKIVDEATGETLGSVVYPDALNAEETSTED